MLCLGKYNNNLGKYSSNLGKCSNNLDNYHKAQGIKMSLPNPSLPSFPSFPNLHGESVRDARDAHGGVRHDDARHDARHDVRHDVRRVLLHALQQRFRKKQKLQKLIELHNFLKTMTYLISLFTRPLTGNFKKEIPR